jgi:hypothetical protein
MAGAGGFNPHAWNAAMCRAGQAVFDVPAGPWQIAVSQQ